MVYAVYKENTTRLEEYLSIFFMITDTESVYQQTQKNLFFNLCVAFITGVDREWQ